MIFFSNTIKHINIVLCYQDATKQPVPLFLISLTCSMFKYNIMGVIAACICCRNTSVIYFN